jgi:hypothetical protein
VSAVIQEAPTTSIESRVPYSDYAAIPAINISRLKELKRSPLHYQHRLAHPKESDALTLGTATHVAVLEPERYQKDFAIWTNRTEAGAMAPRRGKVWDEFAALHAGAKILTLDEHTDANTIARAVRADATAMKYLQSGEPEVSLEWSLDGRPCKGRIDWLTHLEGKPVIVGLKTTRDVRHFAFGSQAAKLEYAMQWSWYRDGYEQIKREVPRMIEIVVESDAPHAVATYVIDNDILLQGRDNYRELLKILNECEASDFWPGPEQGEQFLTLPSWYYPSDEDMSDIGLEAA